MATADTTTGPAGIAMPMRDRLLGAVAAASPSSKGKMPLQLPPPPPGMPASQVEKWRKEVAKIVNKQVGHQFLALCVPRPFISASVLHTA
jgi:hypothetical protein